MNEITHWWQTDAERRDAYRPYADTRFRIKRKAVLGRHTRCWQSDAERRDTNRPDADTIFWLWQFWASGHWDVGKATPGFGTLIVRTALSGCEYNKNKLRNVIQDVGTPTSSVDRPVAPIPKHYCERNEVHRHPTKRYWHSDAERQHFFLKF